MRITNKEILESLDEHVCGHNIAKKTLISMVARSRLRYFQKYMREVHDDYLLNPMKVLLIGGSGTGKTHLVESLRRVMHFPLVRIDATHLGPAASSGMSPKQVMSMMDKEAKRACEEFPYIYFSVEEALDKMVVFVDEVDKLGMKADSSGNWNKYTQSSFLTLFDNKDKYAGVSYVFAGAFTDLTKKDTKKSLGFVNQNHDADDKIKDIDEAIQCSGLIPELVGRINSIIQLDTFTEQHYYDILVNKILEKKYMDLAAYGIFDASIDESDLRDIAKKAKASNQGIRYLHRAIDAKFLELEFSAGFADASLLGYDDDL